MIAAFPFGPLAQSVEQLAFNQLVPRSSRGRPTKNGPLSGGPFSFYTIDQVLPHRMALFLGFLLSASGLHTSIFVATRIIPGLQYLCTIFSYQQTEEEHVQDYPGALTHRTDHRLLYL